MFGLSLTLELSPNMRINGKFFTLVLMVCIALWYVYLLVLTPLPLYVVDRDESGVVSFMEALDSADVGRRAVEGKPDCIEYFWLKDGLPAYEDCSDKNHQL